MDDDDFALFANAVDSMGLLCDDPDTKTQQMPSRAPLLTPNKTEGTTRKGWTDTENVLLDSVVNQYGEQWRIVAAHFPGRSDDSVRNHYRRKHKIPFGTRNTTCKASKAPPWSKVELEMLRTALTEGVSRVDIFLKLCAMRGFQPVRRQRDRMRSLSKLPKIDCWHQLIGFTRKHKSGM